MAMINKRAILIIILIILGFGFYLGGFYTYFLRTEVSEELPVLMQEAATIIKMGNFTDVDFIHKGYGQALVLRQSNNLKILRFENFKVTNGPDLYVYLVKSENPGHSLESLGNYIDLGPLRGNVGDQNYEIRQDIEGYDTVVIWCKKFSALFSYAILK